MFDGCLHERPRSQGCSVIKTSTSQPASCCVSTDAETSTRNHTSTNVFPQEDTYVTAVSCTAVASTIRANRLAGNFHVIRA